MSLLAIALLKVTVKTTDWSDVQHQPLVNIKPNIAPQYLSTLYILITFTFWSKPTWSCRWFLCLHIILNNYIVSEYIFISPYHSKISNSVRNVSNKRTHQLKSAVLWWGGGGGGGGEKNYCLDQQQHIPTPFSRCVPCYTANLHVCFLCTLSGDAWCIKIRERLLTTTKSQVHSIPDLCNISKLSHQPLNTRTTQK